MDGHPVLTQSGAVLKGAVLIRKPLGTDLASAPPCGWGADLSSQPPNLGDFRTAHRTKVKKSRSPSCLARGLLPAGDKKDSKTG